MVVDAPRIAAAVAALFDHEVALLQELVRLPSVPNDPAERLAVRRMADVLRDDLKLSAVEEWDVTLDDIKSERHFAPPFGEWRDIPTVVGIHRPTSQPAAGQSLILNGHLDVVPTGPPDLWTHPPFDPVIDGDWLYGRGSGDMKAGVVAAVFAFRALQSLGVQPASEVQFHFVLDEESTGNGALAAVKRFPGAAACVIPEPFPFLMSAQLGVLWLHVEVTGRPAHVWDTAAGVNAIQGAMRLFAALREVESGWNDPTVRPVAYKDHPHPINFNLGRIEGGEWGSTVPSRCTMTIRAGFFPGTPAADVQRQLEGVLSDRAKAVGVTCRISYGGFVADGFAVDVDGPLMTALRAAHQTVTGEEGAIPVAPACCTTDARHYHFCANIPTTCFGPRSVKNIHGIDERVSLQSLQEVTTVLAVFLAQWCGLEPLRPDPPKGPEGP